MSLFGSMDTAISGLSAQAAAFSNISDNMANSQTVGYKSVNTSFMDYLTTSSASQNQSGSVATRPDYENELQGSIQQSSDALGMAISGQGFFSVSEQAGVSTNGAPQFSAQRFYTRAGDFTRDDNGYLKNSAGEYLNGWAVSANGSVNRGALLPIQVNQSHYAPVATSAISLVANVPSSPTSTSNLTSDTQVYDATGAARQLQTSWTETSANQWDLTVSSPDNIAGGNNIIGSIPVTFNPNGTLASLGVGVGALANSSSAVAGDVKVSPDFGSGPQSITLSLGDFGIASGVTQFAGSNYTITSATQDGAPGGSFTSVAADSNGNITANYDNGRSVTIAQVPLTTFADADALQRQNGEAYTATQSSGIAQVGALGENGAGTLVIGSTESSNVDIAAQLSKLIVAQQAYGANAKVITTANELLTTSLNMKQ